MQPTINTVAGDDLVRTDEQSSSITGTRASGAVVSLLVGGQVRTIGGSGTTWSYTLTAQDILNMGQGTEVLEAVQTDAAGNTSAASKRSIEVKTISLLPAPTVDNLPGDNIINAAEQQGTVLLQGSNAIDTAGVTITIAGVSRAATVRAPAGVTNSPAMTSPAWEKVLKS